MAEHTDWRSYATDVAPRLAAYLSNLRRPAVENWLHRSFWIFSFVHENLAGKISENKEVARQLYPLITEAQDILRGLIHAQEAVLLAAATLQARTAFELRCTIAFITESADPAKYADRFVRYAEVEKFMYQTGSPNAPQLTKAEKASIRQRCPEWFKADGTVRRNLNWTAEEATNNIKRIAETTGLLDAYLRGYAISSKITHGSPLVKNLYSTAVGTTSIADPGLCAMQTMSGAGDILSALIAFCGFAGVSMPQDDVLAHLLEGNHLAHVGAP